MKLTPGFLTKDADIIDFQTQAAEPKQAESRDMRPAHPVLDYSALLQQRDELLAAAKLFRSYCSSAVTDADGYAEAVAAIASARKGEIGETE